MFIVSAGGFDTLCDNHLRARVLATWEQESRDERGSARMCWGSGDDAWQRRAVVVMSLKAAHYTLATHPWLSG